MKPYTNKDPIRLVLADVDGTLVTQEKVLTEKAKAAVAKLKDAGITFAITSGRPPGGMRTVIKDLNLTTVVAGFNGGVYVTPRFDPIVTRDLPKDAAARALELITGHGLVAWLYTDTVWCLCHGDLRAGRQGVAGPDRTRARARGALLPRSMNYLAIILRAKRAERINGSTTSTRTKNARQQRKHKTVLSYNS
jgi:hypothetical protein